MPHGAVPMYAADAPVVPDCGERVPTGTVAAVAFAVVLFKIVRSAAVSSALSSIVVSALHAI